MKFTALGSILLLSILCSNTFSYANTNLPILTDRSSAIINTQSEFQLGRNWARILKGRAALNNDPLVYTYLEDLIWDLVPHTQLQDRRLELIVLNNLSINAFAAPGGIIGINNGLILTTKTEDQLASVITHELAHLSQRHYAQRLDEQRKNQPFMLAGMLASILISSIDPNAATAIATSTMGASAQAQLTYSRRHEIEADNIGINTLIGANRDPREMANMFSLLQESQRFSGQKPPEFLMTHPVTETRIANALNRASTNSVHSSNRSHNPDFDIIKTRLQVSTTDAIKPLLASFTAQLQQGDNPSARYGSMLAYAALGDFTRSDQAFQALPDSWKHNLIIQLSQIDILAQRNELSRASQLLSELLSIYPGNLSVTLSHAQVLRQMGDASAAAMLLRTLTTDYAHLPFIWFELAETEGLAGNTVEVHLARTEYFLATGQIDRAIQQIAFARLEKSMTSPQAARLDEIEVKTKELRKQFNENL